MATEEKGFYTKVTVYATSTAPYHSAGEKIECSQSVADKMLANGWATEKPETGKKQKDV